jgi:hypothetical protein
MEAEQDELLGEAQSARGSARASQRRLGDDLKAQARGELQLERGVRLGGPGLIERRPRITGWSMHCRSARPKAPG